MVVVLPSPAGVGLIADQLAALAALHLVDEVLADLCLVMAVGQKMLGSDADLLADLEDRLLLRGAGDFDVGFDAHD